MFCDNKIETDTIDVEFMDAGHKRALESIFGFEVKGTSIQMPIYVYLDKCGQINKMERQRRYHWGRS